MSLTRSSSNSDEDRFNVVQLEFALRGLDGVTAAAAEISDDGHQGVAVVVYVSRQESSGIEADEIRTRLASLIQEATISLKVMFLDQLPVDASGCLDRTALPSPNHSRPELDNSFVAPRTDIERQMCEAWSRILEVEPVGVRDDFLDLGGDSLAAFRFIGYVEIALRQELDITTVFDHRSIEELAKLVDELIEIRSQQS